MRKTMNYMIVIVVNNKLYAVMKSSVITKIWITFVSKCESNVSVIKTGDELHSNNRKLFCCPQLSPQSRSQVLSSMTYGAYSGGDQNFKYLIQNDVWMIFD